MSLRPDQRDRFRVLVEDLRSCVGAVDGSPTGGSAYDRQELYPGYWQLLHHLDRALHWAEEMQWIIERELTPRAA